MTQHPRCITLNPEISIRGNDLTCQLDDLAYVDVSPDHGRTAALSLRETQTRHQLMSGYWQDHRLQEGRREGGKEGGKEGRKGGNALFNNALTKFYLCLYGIGYMVKDHSDSKKRNPLLP